MRLQHIRYFLVVCEELNFTRAAKRCKITQPSLSNAVKTLERELGGKLFDRRPPVSMTTFADKVRPYLRRALANFDRAKTMRAARSIAIGPGYSAPLKMGRTRAGRMGSEYDSEIVRP